MKIVLSVILAMFLVACSNENKKTDEAPAKEAQTQTVVEEVKKEAVKVEEKTIEAVEEVVKEEKAVEEAITKTPEAPAAQEQKVAEVTASIDGAKLFAKCVACHGANGEKSALNKSQIIKGWSADKVLTALHGYKDGTYGSSMKGVMKSQISSLSEDELKALAQHISKL
ncbi:c-type cytochrome [Sulfurimonas sp.]|uniref:c-type cytochrome n=1 Tax=Sulfurimonas sp. TaxID=2022749 RepID=UPI003D0C14B9